MVTSVTGITHSAAVLLARLRTAASRRPYAEFRCAGCVMRMNGHAVMTVSLEHPGFLGGRSTVDERDLSELYALGYVVPERGSYDRIHSFTVSDVAPAVSTGGSTRPLSIRAALTH